jgi:hypothetical protein
MGTVEKRVWNYFSVWNNKNKNFKKISLKIFKKGVYKYRKLLKKTTNYVHTKRWNFKDKLFLLLGSIELLRLHLRMLPSLSFFILYTESVQLSRWSFRKMTNKPLSLLRILPPLRFFASIYESSLHWRATLTIGTWRIAGFRSSDKKQFDN